MKDMLKNIIEQIINILLSLICKKVGSCGDDCSYKG